MVVTAKGSAARTWTLRLAPWVIAGGMTLFVLQRHSYREILEQMRQGDALSMIPHALLGPLIYLAIVSLADLLILRALDARVSYYDVFRGKGATATLAALSYVLGGGAYALWIAKRTKHGAKEVSASLLYILASDLTAVCILASVAMFATEVRLPEELKIVAPALACAWPLVIAIGPRKLILPWPKVPRLHAYVNILVRCTAISVSSLAAWTGARAFGLELPFGATAVHMPIILLVQALPVNVGGFGAVQGVWLVFFTPYVEGAKILAFQILWQLMLSMSMVLRGLPFLPRVTEEIGKRKS
jgi:hypothetical protein